MIPQDLRIGYSPLTHFQYPRVHMPRPSLEDTLKIHAMHLVIQDRHIGKVRRLTDFQYPHVHLAHPILVDIYKTPPLYVLEMAIQHFPTERHNGKTHHPLLHLCTDTQTHLRQEDHIVVLHSQQDLHVRRTRSLRYLLFHHHHVSHPSRRCKAQC